MITNVPYQVRIKFEILVVSTYKPTNMSYLSVNFPYSKNIHQLFNFHRPIPYKTHNYLQCIAYSWEVSVSFHCEVFVILPQFCLCLTSISCQMSVWFLGQVDMRFRYLDFFIKLCQLHQHHLPSWSFTACEFNFQQKRGEIWEKYCGILQVSTWQDKIQRGILGSVCPNWILEGQFQKFSYQHM